MISVHQLYKRYPNAARPALVDVDLTVDTGCVFGLLGPNGAGKTTLMSILCATQQTDRGTVTVDGIDVAADPQAVRPLIGYAPQSLAFYPGLSVHENLDLFGALTQGSTRATRERAIDVANLRGHLGRMAGTLSGGLKRRLNFAIALLGQPRMLCLDEPTAGVDPQSRNDLLDAVRRLGDEGVTVIYSTHYMEEIERVCSRAAILADGRVLAEDTVGALRAGHRTLESTFLALTQHCQSADA